MLLQCYYYLRNGVVADFISSWNGYAMMTYNLFSLFTSLGQPNFKCQREKKKKS